MNDEYIYSLLMKKLTENIAIMQNYKVEKTNKKTNDKVGLYYTSYDVILYSKVLNRKVSIGMVDYYDHKVVDIILYKVLSYDEHIDGSIYMNLYLTKHLKLDNDNKIMYLSNNIGETLDMKLQDFFVRFLSVVDDLFFEILEGKAWIEIPFDWGPYK